MGRVHRTCRFGTRVALSSRMAIRESGSGSVNGTPLARSGGGRDVAALWQPRHARTDGQRKADHDTAVTRTLASSTNPTLLFEHLPDTKGWPT